MARISRLKTTLDKNNTALILFDALHGDLHPKDAAKVRFLKEHNIIENMRRLHDTALKTGIMTFYPSGHHAPDGSDVVERLTDTDMNLNPIRKGDKRIVPHIKKNSKDAEVAAELKPGPGDMFIPKNRWSSFFETNLELQLRVRGLDTVVIAGGSTDVGVAATVFAARDLDLGIVVVSDACYSARGNNNEFFMTRVFPRMGRVMTVEQTVKLMKA